jgi:putative transposase
VDLSAYTNHVRMDFSRPGKPTDNCYVETFNGSLRDECLNVHWFETLEDARAKIEAWRIDYNDSRPHQGLKEMTPNEYALKSRSIELEMVPQQAGD